MEQMSKLCSGNGLCDSDIVITTFDEVADRLARFVVCFNLIESAPVVCGIPCIEERNLYAVKWLNVVLFRGRQRQTNPLHHVGR